MSEFDLPAESAPAGLLKRLPCVKGDGIRLQSRRLPLGQALGPKSPQRKNSRQTTPSPLTMRTP
jgi:hypothetical protein